MSPMVEKIEAEIHHQATVLYPDLMKNLALGIFEMRVNVQPVGTIRTARKIKRLVDRPTSQSFDDRTRSA